MKCEKLLTDTVTMIRSIQLRRSSSRSLNFEFSSEHTQLRDVMRSFVKEKVIPVAAQYDKSMEFPWEIIKKAHSCGFLSTTIPQEYVTFISYKKSHAYAVTEPGAGSDVAGITTKCVKKGDEYIINGSKMWITNGGPANW
uniref:Acyl-CoA_dh_N domain-containing protein n=1 Tax=Heterorhabditis bacteriophora TaxID=37862 RepID=A0A1I7WNN9_HETBA